MRRLALAGLTAAALSAGLLAGCATPTERPDRAMRWNVSVNAEEGAKLVLGVPDTDDIRLMMVCQPHSGEVSVTVVARRGDPAALELHSGEVVGRYAGAGHEDDESLGAVDLDFKTTVSDPVLARLADTGELAIVFPTRRIALPNAFSPAHDFLKVCRPL